jgi:hypothetical protein
MSARSREHRPLQGHAVFGVVWLGLHRPTVRHDRIVEIAGPHCGIALFEGAAGASRAPCDDHRQHKQEPWSIRPSDHWNLKSEIRIQKSAIHNQQFSRSGEPDRLPSASICVGHLDRVWADAKNAIAAFDEIAHAAANRRVYAIA